MESHSADGTTPNLHSVPRTPNSIGTSPEPRIQVGTSVPNQVCQICGAWGNHSCLGFRPATYVNVTPDWNRAIDLFERLVVLLEKHLRESQ